MREHDLYEMGARAIDAWPGCAPPLSDHAKLEFAAMHHWGRSLKPGEPVPGCGCPTCTGIPKNHPARVPAWKRRNPEGGRAKDRERCERWKARVAAARRVPILEVTMRLGCGDPVKRGREIAVCCPLHQDTSPSLRVKPDSGLWYCDPCGEGGDPIRLYMRARGLAFAAAVRELAA